MSIQTGKSSIGIDPGVKTGFAVYSIDLGQLLEVETVDFWTAVDKVMFYPPSYLTRVVIEVPDTKHVWQGGAKNAKTLQRQAVNVGGVIREAQLLAEGLEREGYPVVRVPPRGKVDPTKFARYTGWKDRCSQHARDAAMLCYGR